MKHIFAFTLIALLLSVPAAFAADDLPMTLAGITLGDDAKDYAKLCDPALDSPMPDSPFLSETHVKADSIPGIRGGSLIYGNCANKEKVIRIKLKFHNRGQGLFDKLKRKYEKTYGKANSYKGDAFKNVIAWQWDFAKGDKRVSLILMWSRDKEIRPGVSIKMTDETLLNQEYSCFMDKMNKAATGKKGPSKVKNLDMYVPR